MKEVLIISVITICIISTIFTIFLVAKETSKITLKRMDKCHEIGNKWTEENGNKRCVPSDN